MNSKLAADITSSEDNSELLNPFVHHLELGTTSEKIKTAFLTVVLLPIRVLLICILLISGWFLACLGLWGLSEEDLQKRPVSGWRRKLTELLCILGKATYRAGGMSVVFKGRQASREEAPILVIAPHSTFLDGGIIYYMGFPSIIVRRESGNNPYIGKLINFTQPVYVWRDDPDSRQNTIKEIIHRATSKEDWPQILIFPEGTCTNRSCLITFKPGAFYPGVPIQPVCIRYPNKLDTVTWTWEGPSALKLLWLTLTQVYSHCEIEFLPVYVPSEEEKKDPKLFANNVRAVMAKALGVPVVDYTYDDCRLMTKAKAMNLPNANSLVEVQKLRQKLSLNHDSSLEEQLVETISCNKCKNINLSEFTGYLRVSKQDPNAQHLFKLYEKNIQGTIDFREYLLGVIAVLSNKKTLDILRLAFKIYSTNSDKLSCDDFTTVLNHTLATPENECHEIFNSIDKTHLEYVTFENFVNFARKKAEYAGLFSLSKRELNEKLSDICPHEKEE